MRQVRRTAQFKRDVKRLEKQGKDLHKLKEVLLALALGENLVQRYSDHVLVGQHQGNTRARVNAISSPIGC